MQRGISARSILLAICFFALSAGGCSGSGKAGNSEEGGNADEEITIGLYTSLPILWREVHDLSDLLDSEKPPHWALPVLTRHGRLEPLDTLAPSSGIVPLDERALLVMAQPRPLSPDENVALDVWVRGGGRVLLFADPMLTEKSAFAPGDRRRPQDIALLSPILTRWGLELHFDDAQSAGEREAKLLGVPLPVNLPGRFNVIADVENCRVEGSGLLAECRVGNGKVLALADAAILENSRPEAIDSRRRALDRLLLNLKQRP